MAPKLLTNSRVVVKKLWWKSENESCCKLFFVCFLFLGLFLPHFHLKQPVLTRYCLSGTIETAPNREDPLLALRSEILAKWGEGDWKKTKTKHTHTHQKKSMELFSWCLFKMLRAWRPKGCRRIPADAAREARWWTYLRESVLIFYFFLLPTGRQPQTAAGRGCLPSGLASVVSDVNKRSRSFCEKRHQCPGEGVVGDAEGGRGGKGGL